MLRDFVYAARTLALQPGLCRCGDDHDRIGHRGEHRHLQRRGRGAPASVALQRPRTAGLRLRRFAPSPPDRLPLVFSDLADFRAHASPTIEDAAGANTFRAVYRRDDGSSEEIAQANVTPNLFRVLGARVILGRDFVESDALPQPVGPNGQPAPPDRQLPVYGIISHEFFERRFGGNPAVLGQPIAKGGAIIVGVLEPGVELLFPPTKTSSASPISGSRRALRRAVRASWFNGASSRGCVRA